MKKLIAILLVLFGFMVGTAFADSDHPPKNHIWHHGKLLDCTKPRPDSTEFPDPCKDSKDFTDHEWAAWMRSRKDDIIIKCIEDGIEKWQELPVHYLKSKGKELFPDSKEPAKDLLNDILKELLHCKVID